MHQRTTKWGDLRVDDAQSYVERHPSTEELADSSNVLISQYGIPRDPMDFAMRAVKCGHPRGLAIHLPDMVTEVLAENMYADPAELALKRCRELTKWTIRAKQLQITQIGGLQTLTS